MAPILDVAANISKIHQECHSGILDQFVEISNFRSDNSLDT